MNHLKFIALSIAIFYVDQLLLGISGNLCISVLLPVTVYLGTRKNLSRAIIFAFSTGIFSDMIGLRAFPLMAIFLVAVAILVHYLQQKYLEFHSMLAIFLTTVLLYAVEIAILTAIYAGPFGVVTIYSFLLNSIVGAFVIFWLFSVSRRGLYGE